MFSGYLGEEPAGDWYRTGDVGHLDDDGYLYITGRSTNVVQVGGNRVSTDEVMEALRSHPQLANALVVAVDDSTWGTRLEAFVVADGGCEVDPEHIGGWLRHRLPAYKVPRRFHLLDEIPVDASGKASLKTLQEMARSA
jgi:acyl-CoA synthetase (AMP-forming)/AMP-acid ligase II